LPTPQAEILRYLVPATAFCEPDEGSRAKWHWFALKPADQTRSSPSSGIYRVVQPDIRARP